MKNRITVWMYSHLFVHFIVLTLFMCVVFPGGLLYIDRLKNNIISILAISIFIIGIWGVYIMWKSVGTRLIISENGVKFKVPFNKSVLHTMDFYTNCDKAYYLYYGMPSYYIVLSNFKLRTDELCHINRMEMNDRCIRIKYNKKNFDALMQMLPPKLAASLENQFKDIKAPKVNFIP